MDIIFLILSLAAPTLLGWEVLGLFFPGTGVFFYYEKIFLAYGFGFGFTTMMMFFLSLIGAGFSITPFLFIFAILLILIRKFRKNTPKEKKIYIPKSSLGNTFVCFCSIILLLLIICNIGIVFFRTMIIDIDMWDSWAFWSFKAKIFYVHKTVPLEMFQQFKKVWGNWDYPLHVPLMETWVLLWLGYWNDVLLRIIFPFFYTGVCVICFYFLRRNISLIASLIGTFFFSSLPALQIYTIGTVAEPILLFYYLASFLLLYRWLQEGNDRFLILSAIFAGLALWTKSEGFILVMGNILIIAFFLLINRQRKNVWHKLIWYIFTVVAIIFPWNLFKMLAHIENVAFNQSYFQMERIPVYLSRIAKIPNIFCFYFLNFHAWNMVWLIMGIAVIYSFKSPQNRLVNYILFSIIFQCFIFSLGYITIPWQENVFIYDTLVRLMIAPAMLAILYSSLILSREAYRNLNKRNLEDFEK